MHVLLLSIIHDKPTYRRILFFVASNNYYVMFLVKLVKYVAVLEYDVHTYGTVQ